MQKQKRPPAAGKGASSRKRSAKKAECEKEDGPEVDKHQDEEGNSSRSAQNTTHHAGISPTEDAVSAKIRKEGNEMYKRAFQDGIPSVIKCSRLENALRLYNRAANEARGLTQGADWSSALKNCGMTMKRLAQEYKMVEAEDDGYRKTLNTFRESMKYMSRALHCSSYQSITWGVKIKEEMEESYLEIHEIMELFDDTKQRLKELYKVTSLIPPGVVSVNAKFHIADILFKESIRLLESEDYKNCFNCLHDISQPIEEALRILRELGDDVQTDSQVEDLREDLEILKQDALYHMSTAESIQARKCGERMLAELLEDEEFFNMDAVWDVIDWFKQASLKAAELDLEQEAAAMSFLGFVNEKILQSTVKTKHYYKRCLELVEAAKPKTFLTQRWYQQCVSGLQKIQNVDRQRDEVEQQKLKEEILVSLTAEITALENANTSAADLLAYIYKHHTPSTGRKFTDKHLQEFVENDKGDSSTEMKARKKLLLKACLDFHPDRFTATVKEGETEEDQNKRKVLNEEITKMLTKHYEIIKLG